MEGGILDNPEENPRTKMRTSNKINSGKLWHWAGIEPGPHCAISAPLVLGKIFSGPVYVLSLTFSSESFSQGRKEKLYLIYLV